MNAPLDPTREPAKKPASQPRAGDQAGNHSEASLRSRCYIGEVTHARLEPVTHRFRYPFFTFVFDIDELPEIDRRFWWFGHNRWRPISFRDRDYQQNNLDPGPLRPALESLLRDHGWTGAIGCIELVTMPRFLGYAFNPVSFWYIHRPDGTLGACIAEVNNTMGQRHVYVLDHLQGAKTVTASADKTFHVSPFYDRSGRYCFHFAPLDETLHIRVDKHGESADSPAHFLTSLTGSRHALTHRQAARLFFCLGRIPFLTMPRILWQAAFLKFRHHLSYHPKPIMNSSMSREVRPPSRFKWRQRLAMNAVLRVLGGIVHGGLRVRMPDGSTRLFGSTNDPAELHIRDYRFFTRVMNGGDIGFGESWMAGECDSPDLTKVLATIVRNPQLHDKTRGLATRAFRKANAILHASRPNSEDGSRINIAAHYDLSNDFFQRFLDPQMIYSSALYSHPTLSLEDAQRAKLDALIHKAGITADHHVLEIGCGWGGFAIHAAKTTGCRVTGITVSEKQKEFADAWIAREGLQDRIDIQLRDYRRIEGTFDKIVSIEMLEAVGHEFLPAYFDACDRALVPGGTAAIQVITIPDHRYESYRNGCDWIQKYIFPGGMLPSLTAMRDAFAPTSLHEKQIDEIGPHYAPTLAAWRERFEANWSDIKPLGFDEPFRRMWIYYLCYCEAGFANDHIHVKHLVLEKG